MAGSLKFIASPSSSDSPPEEIDSSRPVSGDGRGKRGKESFLVGDVRFKTHSFSREGAGIGGKAGDPIVPIAGRGRGRRLDRGSPSRSARRSTTARSSLSIGGPSSSAGGARRSTTDRSIGGPSSSAGGAGRSTTARSSSGGTSLARSSSGADLQPIGALAGTDRGISRVRSSSSRRVTRSGIVKMWREIDSVFNRTNRPVSVGELGMFLKQRNSPAARRPTPRSRRPPAEVVEPVVPIEVSHFLQVIEGDFGDRTTVRIDRGLEEEMKKDIMVACAVRKFDFI